MSLFICLDEMFDGGWYGYGKEDWVFWVVISGGSWFTDRC